jgi:hypothetical protein
MKSSKRKFLKKLIKVNMLIYPGLLGIVHPLIAHGLTGDHDRLLTTPQFIMIAGKPMRNKRVKKT